MRHLQLLAVFVQGLYLSVSTESAAHFCRCLHNFLEVISCAERNSAHQRTGELAQAVTFSCSRNKMLCFRHTAQPSQSSTGRESLFGTRITLENTLPRGGAALAVHSRHMWALSLPEQRALIAAERVRGGGNCGLRFGINACWAGAAGELCVPHTAQSRNLSDTGPRCRHRRRRRVRARSPRPGSAPRAGCPRAEPAAPTPLPAPSRHRTRSSPPAPPRLSGYRRQHSALGGRDGARAPVPLLRAAAPGARPRRTPAPPWPPRPPLSLRRLSGPAAPPGQCSPGWLRGARAVRADYNSRQAACRGTAPPRRRGPAPQSLCSSRGCGSEGWAVILVWNASGGSGPQSGFCVGFFWAHADTEPAAALWAAVCKPWASNDVVPRGWYLGA